MLEGVGLLVLPLTFRLFRHLPDRGYSFSKPLGLILVNYVLWILSTLGFLRNTVGNILLAALLALVLSLFLYRRGQKKGAAWGTDLRAWAREQRGVILASELVFTLAFVLWVFYKAYDPNIAVTEKPMEFAFVNAITRSSRFPPYDPWFSGHVISYYHFGYIIVATLAKFAQIPTNFAFNLGLAMLFALTASGAFGVTYNMVCVSARRGRGREARSGGGAEPSTAMRVAISFGVLAALMIPLMGNLEGALEFAHANGVGVTTDEQGLIVDQHPFWEWIDIKNLTNRGTVSQTWYPTDGWWWWRASRVIHDKGLTGNDMEVIDEFPAFSFLLGDMHPHVLAYPFVLVLIALAFNLLLSRTDDRSPTDDVPPVDAERPADDAHQEVGESPSPLTETDWWLVYLCLGAIGFLNTWDMPFYFFLLVAAYGLNRYLHPEQTSRSLVERALGRAETWVLKKNRFLASTPWLRQIACRAIELGIASVLLYLPYWLYSRPKAGSGILPNLFNVSRFAQLFLMFGTFFVVLIALLVVMYRELWRKRQVTRQSLLRQGLPIWVGTMLFFPALVALVLVPLVLSPATRTYIDDVLADPNVQQFLGAQTLGSLLKASLRVRLGLLPPELKAFRMPAGPWTFLILSLFVAGVIFWFVRTTFPSWLKSVGNEIDSPSPSLHFAMLMAFTGLMLIVSVEFLYLRDAFGTRMNTVFKFYFQAWVLLGLVAAFGSYYVIQKMGKSRLGRWAFGLVLALLLGAGLLYPVGMSINRTGGFSGPATLDGMAFVARERPEEYAALQWLNENVTGNPVIVESVRGSFAYEHARVSSRTGLPAVMGWTGHVGQWHGLYEEIGERERDVQLLYSGGIQDAQAVMDKYGVTYVYVGYLEQAEFGPLDKFRRFMDVAFRQGNTVIYERRK